VVRQGRLARRRQCAEQSRDDVLVWARVAQDYAQAASWYRKAADQGYTLAQSSLGSLYAAGKGVPQDYAKALMWLRKAADQGDANAQYNLGVMYISARGVPLNYAVAATWFNKAAVQGYVRAETNLGIMYQHGDGVPRDEAKAVAWYRKAAAQGDVDAQSELVLMHVQPVQAPPSHVSEGSDTNLPSRYIEVIRDEVMRNWLRPDNLPSGACLVHVTQLPGGKILSAVVDPGCPYDPAGRRSVENAVLRTYTLPYKGFQSVFQRTITLTFNR
jgi:hypothetical protein